jgi:hypothetical protein
MTSEKLFLGAQMKESMRLIHYLLLLCSLHPIRQSVSLLVSTHVVALCCCLWTLVFWKVAACICMAPVAGKFAKCAGSKLSVAKIILLC